MNAVLRAAILGGACVVALGAAALEPAPSVTFTDEEARRILALGPWPPAPQVDSSNRVSGNKTAIALGEQLFRDPSLSRNGQIACATCHQPARAFNDGLARGRGLAAGDRNTISLLNVGGQRWYGWDGANDSLWAQSLRPLLDAKEMGSDFARMAARVRSDPALRTAYTATFGRAPPANDEVVAVDAAKALAAYQETLVTGITPFDEFRDALARGDGAAMARYPIAARRGLAIFVGSGHCTECHNGPRLSNGEFHDVGIPPSAESGRADSGRHGGVRKLQASRYNLFGPFNDDATHGTAMSKRYIGIDPGNDREFKVPSLRNVARTAPYMHDGSLATLRDVVRHYSNIDLDRLHADDKPILQPFDLDKYDVDSLVAFLESLSESIAPVPATTPGH